MAKLSNRNYFSRANQKIYMGVSQFKAFEKCPASALAEIKGKYKREKTVSLLVGSYVDSYFEGSMKKFRRQNPDIFKKDGTLKADYRKADEIIHRIEKDRMFMEYLSGAKQVIMTGEIEGVPVKIKVDSMHSDKIVDLKIMKDFSHGFKLGAGRLNWIEYWGYDLQGAVYQEIVRQNTGKKLPFFLAGATKEAEPDIGIFEVSQSYLDVSLDKFKKYVQFYDAMKKGIIPVERCESCNYCKSTKVLTEPIMIEDLDDN
jgi:hypothetical protein